jgi:hypothetical protein
VSWLPGQILDRNSALTAMTLAEIAGTGDLKPGHRLWPAVESWSAELGMSAPAISPAPPSHLLKPSASREHPGGAMTGRLPIDPPSPA